MEAGLDALAESAILYVKQNFTEDMLEEFLEYNDALDLSKCIDFDTALTIVQSRDDWATEASADVHSIVSLITFENSHLVGYSLFHSNLEAAVALHNELEYYIKGSSC
jgi:hypothetical protein